MEDKNYSLKEIKAYSNKIKNTYFSTGLTIMSVSGIGIGLVEYNHKTGAGLFPIMLGLAGVILGITGFINNDPIAENVSDRMKHEELSDKLKEHDSPSEKL